MNLNYYILQKDRKGMYNILLYAVQDGVQFRYNTKIKVSEKQWNKKKQICIDTNIAADINFKLASIRTIATQYFVVNDEVSRQGLIDWMNEKLNRKVVAKEKTFMDVITDFVSDVGNRKNANGEKISEHRVRLYNNFLRSLKAFEQTRSEKLSFATFDQKCCDDFKNFLVNTYKLSPNTLAVRNRMLRTIFSAVERSGVNVNQAYKQSKVKQIKSEHIVLNEQELQQIYDYDCSWNERLQNVKDLFTVGCTTGMRFSDYSRLRIEHITNGKITIHQQKTGRKVTIPVHPVLKDMLATRGLPHTISNAKFNIYLRELCKLSGINTKVEVKRVVGGERVVEFKEKWELVSSHICRRSFATNLYLKGINPKLIMLLTGHTQLSTFMNYIVLDADCVYNVVKDIWGDAC